MNDREEGDTPVNTEQNLVAEPAQEPVYSAEEKPKVNIFKKIGGFIHGLRVKYANWRGPKLDKLRTDEKAEELPEFFVPESLEDLVWFLKRVPQEVLTPREREILTSSMTFSDKKVRDIMLPHMQITYVHENDFMGPKNLDRLYKSGFSHFPVLGTRGNVVGVLHTRALTSLEIKETDRASSFIDSNVFYLRDDYSLEQALAAFLRTNCYFMMVVNSNGLLVGLLTFKMLISHLVGKMPEDDFTLDANNMSVARRKLN